MFWLHFSARFGRKGTHVVPPSALASPLHGSWARQVVVLTPLCAAGPYRWSMGDLAHTATYRVNVRMKGPRHPPIRRSRLSGCRALMSATHGVAGPHDPYCIDIPEQKGPQIREAPTVTSGRFACCQALLRRRSSSAPARGHARSPLARNPRGRRRSRFCWSRRRRRRTASPGARGIQARGRRP